MACLREVAETVLEARYLRQDEPGAVVETPEGMFRQVARHPARPEGRFGGNSSAGEDAFFELMTDFDFHPELADVDERRDGVTAARRGSSSRYVIRSSRSLTRSNTPP